MPRKGERLLPTISALVLAASYPPLHVVVLPFVGMVPLIVWLADLPAGREGRHAATRGGALFATIYFGLVNYWLLVALLWFTLLAVPAFLAALTLIVLVSALFFRLMHVGLRRFGLPVWIVVPVVWTALEWTRAHFPSTLAFPWLGLGTSLTGTPRLVGIAEVVGSRGVTFWIVLVNALVAGVIVRVRASSPWVRHALTVALVVALPGAWGVWRASTLPLRPAGTVSVVQPNIPEDVKLDATTSVEATFAALDRLAPELDPAPRGLTVLPEMTLSIVPRAPQFRSEVERLSRWSRQVGSPVLFGGYGFEENPDGSATPYNAVFVLDGEGLSDFQYEKHRLVPIVERVPFLPDFLLGRLGVFGSYGAGEDYPILELGGAAYGVLICYESAFPAMARRYRLEGADVLINVTNDAWYGREPAWSRTSALWQHPAHMVMRAIENRVGVARAANTGISLFVDPLGHVHGSTELFVPAVSTEEVTTSDVLTIYARVGDVVGWGCALLSLLTLLAYRRLDPPAGLV